MTSGRKRQLKHPWLVAIMMIASMGVLYALRTDQSFASVMYAIQLFSTLVHEIGHSVAALITGGQVHGFVVNATSGGYALTSGGIFAIISPAGYVGCAIFGSMMLYLSNRFRWADGFAFLAGIFIIGFTVAFGKVEDNGSPTALYLAIGFGALLSISGLKGYLWLNMLIVNVLSSLTALNGVTGAWTLHVLSKDWHHNDAEMFSDVVLHGALTGNQVALIWAGFSVFCLALACFGVVKTIFHGGTRQWNYIDIKTKTIHKE